MMRLFELFDISETKVGRRNANLPTLKNPVAKFAGKKTSAGAHSTNKYTRKEKHKGKPTDE